MAGPFDLTPFQKQNVQSWMRGPMTTDPKALHPDIANMVRDVSKMYTPSGERPVGAGPAMQAAVQGQALSPAQEPVRMYPAMSELASSIPPQGQPRGYSGVPWNAPTATEVRGLGPQSATPDLQTRYSAPIGAKQPAPPLSEFMQKMADTRAPVSDVAQKMSGARPQTATPAEDARFLGKLAGAAGTVGAAMQGAPISTLARGAAVAYPAVNAAGQLFQGLSDAAAGRPNATIEASRPAREQTYRDIAAGEYGHALGSAIRATGQTGGQVLGNMLTPFGNVLRGLTGAPAAAAAAPASAAPQGLSDQQFTPGGLGAYTTARTRATPLDQVVAAPPEVTVPAAAPQTSAPAATAPTRSTVNVIRGGRAPTTYDVSPGVPIGTIVRPEAPRSPAQAVVGDAMSQPLFPGDRPDQPLAVRQAIANLVKSASPRAQTAADRARAAAMTDYDLANKYELDPSPDAQAKAKVYRKRAEDMLKLLYPAASDPMRDLLRQSQEAE